MAVGRRCVYTHYFYGKPAADLPVEVRVPRGWEGPDLLAVERSARRGRLQRLLADRAYAATIPPPRRNDAKYAPMVGNPEGNEAFRADRAEWYARITGERIDDLSLSEQRELCDVLARPFRAYSDGRGVSKPAARGDTCGN